MTIKFNRAKSLIIAEIGNNHEGSFLNAKKMILLAAQAKVDAVKFQTFIPELYSHKDNKKRIKILNKFRLSDKTFIKLKKIAKKNKLLFISTPFDLKSADFLIKHCDIIKISSGDNNFFPLIEKCILSKKKVIISLGLLNFKNKNLLIRNIKKKYGAKYVERNLAFLHCVTSYPVRYSNANLLSILKLKEKNKSITIGYSDHTIGIEASLTATVLGAKIIEKHFTFNKNFSSFRDHKLSADFNELKALSLGIRRIEQMTNKFQKDLSKDEFEMIKFNRRQPFASNKINKGDILSLENMNFLRPSKPSISIDPNFFLKKRIKKKINKDMLIKKEYMR